ncbi:MAG: alanine--tRNA ligase [Bacilli bacterium]|nr:alanine--tRNA ligase [Bacilli bacterium]
MRKLSANEIRQTWLNFFKNKGHRVEYGSSLIPHNDPTLLWINSGVAALKKYFDGSEIPPSRRITNVQRSIRTNDIENVGHTARHHTFFEMLGNFSIGDYFRKEVIPFAFEILISEQYFGMPVEKLYMTYHPEDLETRKLWIECGMPEDHLIPLWNNYWQIGEGPCGPNTEVFFDRGEKYDPDNLGRKMLDEEIENDRYIEIWGIVFSQYNGVEGVDRKDYKELPSKNIDTGAGLERIACILQGTETNFETDLFWPIIEAVKTLCHKEYKDYTLAYRVIADHVRACTFALADGEMFSNEGRGYVLRRLLRRAERYGRVLGIEKPFLYELVDVVCSIMEGFYPYLNNKKEFIKKIIKGEEEKFIKTLANGEQLLRKIVKDTSVLSGEDMFKLYDTFGFPKELTIEICDELGVGVDLDGFNKKMLEQKERARAARGDAQSMNKQSKDLMDFVTPSEFIYNETKCKAKVIGCFVDGVKVDSINNQGEIIVSKTVFYAESGGQIADIGTISNDNFQANVTAVNKAPNKQHLHSITVLFGEISVGDEVELEIDNLRRLKIMRNHSAAHLLQQALTEVLGDHIAQHGSYVSDEFMHFDFSHFSKMNEEELKEVETKVNEWISQAIPSETKVLPIEEAKQIGAKALFNDKYGDTVRVVCIGDVSKEFCGGTHVSNTSDIGCFVIEYEESVAAGVRRIQARTSIEAYNLLKRREGILTNVKRSLSLSSFGEIIDRLKSVLNDRDTLKKTVESLTTKVGNIMSEVLLNKFESYDDINLLAVYLKGTKRDGLLAIGDSLKQSVKDYVIVLIGEDNNQVPVLSLVGGKALEKGYKAGIIVKKVTTCLGGSGGGRPDNASGAGKDASKIGDTLAQIKELLK